MANIRCSTCGEEYSDTYRKCPFCQEDEAIRRGRTIHRSGRRLDKKKRSKGAGGVMLLLLAVVIIGVLGFVFLGDAVTDMMGIRTEQGDEYPGNVDAQKDQQKDPQQNVGNADKQDPQQDTDAEIGTVDGETDGEKDTEGETGKGPDDRQEPLALDQTEITIPAGAVARLNLSGGFGAATWTSSNDNIATVADGAVTGVAGGTITVTATVGNESVTCKVTVTGDPWVSSAVLTLNKTDFTLRSGDPAVQLKVSGTTSPIVWASDNPDVASVSETGLVSRGTQKGRANITASVDGHVLTCIVRVS